MEIINVKEIVNTWRKPTLCLTESEGNGPPIWKKGSLKVGSTFYWSSRYFTSDELLLFAIFESIRSIDLIYVKSTPYTAQF